MPIPVAVQLKVQVCDCLHAGIAGLHPTGDMDVCFLGMLCWYVEISVMG
jgi:hypothetical protein